MCCWSCWCGCGARRSAGPVSGHRTSRCCCCGCSAGSPPAANLPAYADAEEPVSALINDYGPAVASAAAARRRAAMPFIHLEREIWDLRDASGAEIGPRVPESGPWLIGRGAVGRLRPQAEQLLGDPVTLAAAARRLLDRHFTPGLSVMICDAVGLDLAVLEADAA